MVESTDKYLEKFNDEEKKYYKIYLEAKKNFEENYENKKWEYLTQDKKSGLEGYKYDDEEGRRAVKSTITVKASLKVVYDYLYELDSKLKYDNNYEKGHVEKLFNSNLKLIYTQYKGRMFLFSPRDFKAVVFSELNDNQGHIFATSYPADESTHVKGSVRGNVIFNYYRVTKVDEETTNIEFYVLSETGLTQMLVNMVLGDLAMTNKVVKEILEKK